MTQSIENETKAREISFHERPAMSERKSNSPQVTRGSYQFPTLWFSRRGEKQIPTMKPRVVGFFFHHKLLNHKQGIGMNIE